MIIDALKLTAKAGPYITWAWQNRRDISNFPTEAGDFLVAMAENGGDAVQRVGSQLVLGTPDGGRRVLGFIDQTAPQLDSIETAVNGISAGQAALTSSVASLQTVSMVTLGLSAVTPVILLAQYRYLSNQFADLKKSVKDLRDIIEQQSTAKLQAGLNVLENGVNKDDEPLVREAMMPCEESLELYRGRLKEAVDEKRSRELVHYLTRHLAIAMCASARCNMALGYDDSANQLLQKHKPLLKEATGLVFDQAIGGDPSRFLIPELAETVSFDFIRSLIQQADAAGIMADENELKKAATELSPTGFFEYLRPKLFKSKLGMFGKKKAVSQCIADLRQASAIVEETNRVLSLETFLEEAKRTGVRAIDTLKDLDQRKKEHGEAGYVAWAL